MSRANLAERRETVEIASADAKARHRTLAPHTQDHVLNETQEAVFEEHSTKAPQLQTLPTATHCEWGRASDKAANRWAQVLLVWAVCAWRGGLLGT